MDLQYPLTYNLGSLKTINNNESILSKIQNVFDTYLRERLLSPQIGIDVSILYDIPIRELVTRQIEEQLDLIENINYSLSLNQITDKDYEIDLKVNFDDGSNSFLNVPINL